MNNIVQFLWVEGALSKIEQLCLKSFVDFGHTVHLYHYGKLENVPDGVHLRDGSEILPISKMFSADGVSGKSYAGFSDRFRYHLLSLRGGWWFDMDFCCLKNLPVMKGMVFASTWENEWGECANGCAMWCERGDPHMIQIRDRCEEIIASSEGEILFGSIGPFLIQAYVEEYGLRDRVVSWRTFCPYPWRLIRLLAPKTGVDWGCVLLRRAKHQILGLLKNDFRASGIFPDSYALHFHNEIWKSNGMDKNESYFRFSVFERLKKKHGIK